MQKIPYKSKIVKTLNYNINVRTKTILIGTSNWKSLIKSIIFDVYAKFALKWKIDWSQQPHMSSQHNKHMTTSHFDIILEHLIVSKLHGPS